MRALPVAALGDVFFYLEEETRGGVAQVLRLGAPMPYLDLPAHPFEGGAFVAAHVRALAYALAGPSLLANKLSAIAW
ncbi:MAG TPA: hypothetical protein VFE44_08420, partial [Thermoanaerobaculia bacterium]|nr:hypothetical protein [Thermoanaerobaculia bacterium]